MSQRPDGRTFNQLRPIKFTRRYTMHTPGSVLVEFGNTKVLVTASIEERVPRHIHQHPCETHGWLTAEYSMLPGATNTRNQRERQKLSGRTSEIQRLIGRALRACVDMERMGSRTITIDCDVIQADGGTRVASISGAYVALADTIGWLIEQGLLEESPIVTPVAAVSVGVIEGAPVLDLDYAEDSTADVDANVVMNGNGHIIEVQATSEKAPLERKTLEEMMDLADEGIKAIIEAQKQALGDLVACN